MNGKNLVNEHIAFLESELEQAQQNLFFVTSVREVKFLQQKIDYLKKQVKEMKNKKEK